MPRWFVVEISGETPLFQQGVEREIEGTEEEALAGLRDVVDNFAKARTESGRRRQRRQVSRISERSYFVRVHNRKVEQAHFTLAEVVADTHDDALPDTVSGGPGAVPVPGP
ncbi:hypothetical protein OHT52_24440 [Streptomyces sp. NBC_00247]|uniref:hypothetical protein n=1 Tax=Streptomyces sp. NBC_00247 TaxID=2975689 RepID=UPI002E2A1755|nr:hypothetical protein [Streptomyces sp. NBC_00247]